MLKQFGPAVLAIAFCALAAAKQESGPRKSPHETISTTLGGKTITISYGRPYLKGRKAVGGSLVPYDQVWRLGADEATKLTTNADLVISNLKVPKGSYALFTIPGRDRWTLIVNKKADQWGAFDYNQADDLGRTPLQVKQTSSPVEQFTITLQPGPGGSAVLHLAWENTDASTTIRLAE
jgi:Protein of unknown function (DUF2911)